MRRDITDGADQYQYDEDSDIDSDSEITIPVPNNRSSRARPADVYYDEHNGHQPQPQQQSRYPVRQHTQPSQPERLPSLRATSRAPILPDQVSYRRQRSNQSMQNQASDNLEGPLQSGLGPQQSSFAAQLSANTSGHSRSRDDSRHGDGRRNHGGQGKGGQLDVQQGAVRGEQVVVDIDERGYGRSGSNREQEFYVQDEQKYYYHDDEVVDEYTDNTQLHNQMYGSNLADDMEYDSDPEIRIVRQRPKPLPLNKEALQELMRENSRREQEQRADLEAPSKPSIPPRVAKLLALPEYQFLAKLGEEHRKSQVQMNVSHRLLGESEWETFKDPSLRASSEYKRVRYTPIASTDPRDMSVDGYTIRVMELKRRIKLMVCITLYNESWEEVEKSLTGVMENIAHLQGQRFLGRTGKKTLDWSEVAVAFIQDGVHKCDPKVKAVAEHMGFFLQDALQEKNSLGEAVNAHMFEYTIRRKNGDNVFYPPTQIIWLSKVTNARKLSSHAWFFYGLCEQINPDYVVLLDAGAQPRRDAFYHLYHYFEQYQHVGAAGGELMVEWPKSGKFLGHVQYLEWKMAYIFDIPLQHLCGYIQVLPGAFSSYRYKALQGRPLQQYFKGYYKEDSLSAFKRNVYLAEDRILCIEIVAKEGSAYTISYVKQAKCTADHVGDLHKLMGQRRRWLNGSFFAALYAFGRFPQIWTRTKHNLIRKTVLSLEFLFLLLLLLTTSILGVGFLFTFTKELVDVTFASMSDTQLMSQVAGLVMGFYAALLLVELILCLNNRPEHVKKLHWFCAIMFGLFQYGFLVLTGWFLYEDFQKKGSPDDIFQSLSITSLSVIIMMALTFLCILLHNQLIPTLVTGLQYWFMSGAYVNILQVYAFTNSHDLSWGTKGLSAVDKIEQKFDDNLVAQRKTDIRTTVQRRIAGEKKMTREEERLEDSQRQAIYRKFSTTLILFWLITNGLLLYGISSLSDLKIKVFEEERLLGDYYLRALLIGLSILRVFQLVVSLGYICQNIYLKFWNFICCGKRKKPRPHKP